MVITDLEAGISLYDVFINLECIVTYYEKNERIGAE